MSVAAPHPLLEEMYWRRILPAIAMHCGYTLVQAHDALLADFYPGARLPLATDHQLRGHICRALERAEWLGLTIAQVLWEPPPPRGFAH